MRKRVIAAAQQDAAPADRDWLSLEGLAEVEITSEDAAHPIESALLPGAGSGWRAAGPGKQTIRLRFADPQRLRRIRLEFVEPDAERTQEYVLRWSPDGGQSFREIVRQQWNFSPGGATSETEDLRVELAGVTVLELSITPDIGGQSAVASVAKLRLAGRGRDPGPVASRPRARLGFEKHKTGRGVREGRAWHRNRRGRAAGPSRARNLRRRCAQSKPRRSQSTRCAWSSGRGRARAAARSWCACARRA